MQHNYVIIVVIKNQVPWEKKEMKKFLTIAILLSLGIGNVIPVVAAEKTVLSAGAQENVDKNKKKEKKSDKIIPQKNKYEYVNMPWWQQFNDDILNAYIIKAVENNKEPASFRHCRQDSCQDTVSL